MTDATLYVVATPIGNRDDLSPRAREVLARVSFVASEDTRRTGRLLSHFGIKSELVALHEHNEERASRRIVEVVRAGESVALVSDAGTPLISDPGYRLLAMAHEAGLRVSPVPGPSALLAALSVAGLPTDRFAFEGFLPAKAAARRARLAKLAAETRTLVFYEAVHRVRETVDALVTAFGAERRAFVGRELSKLHEQCLQAGLAELAARLADGTVVLKGEFVLVVEGAASEAGSAIDVDDLLLRLVPHMPQRKAAEIVAAVSGERKNRLYQRLLTLQDGD